MFNRKTFSYREFSKQPHIAGSSRQRDLANELAANWTTFGFDKVEKPQYRVLLSFPQPKKPNRVTIVESGNIIYDIPGKIKVRRMSFSVEKILQYLVKNSDSLLGEELIFLLLPTNVSKFSPEY